MNRNDAMVALLEKLEAGDGDGMPVHTACNKRDNDGIMIGSTWKEAVLNTRSPKARSV